MPDHDKREVEAAATFITGLLQFAGEGIRHLPVLRDARADLKSRLAKTQGLAPLFGTDYRSKELDVKYRLERMDGLIQMLEAFERAEEIHGEKTDLQQAHDELKETLQEAGLL